MVLLPVSCTMSRTSIHSSSGSVYSSVFLSSKPQPHTIMSLGIILLETCLLLHSATTGKVLWYFYIFNNFPQFVVIHTVKDLNVVNEAEVDVFLEFSCFLYDAVGGYWQFDFWFRGTTECCTLKAEKADTFSKSSLYV